MDIELRKLSEKLLQSQEKEIKVDVQQNQQNYKININSYNHQQQDNKVKNTKYTLLNFAPKVLYDQFQYFFNLFFLLLCLSQFIPVFKVGLLFSYVAPLVFVLTLTLLKEAYDDIQRYWRDCEINNEEYTVYKNGQFQPKKSQDLKIGDIIKLQNHQRIPTDCVLLHTEEKNKTIFIKTDQLDGETDWKLRIPIPNTQKMADKDILTLQGSIEYEKENKNIYKFQGIYKGDSNFPLNLENTLWCSTVLQSKSALAVVIYNGDHTRIRMNIQKKREKFGSLDQELNSLSKLLFAFMIFISICLHIASLSQSNFVVSVIKYILLLSTIIPISLRVNLDFSKIVFSQRINNDKKINSVARNSQIPEELGRIGVVLSDKTGTLTKNDMQFKKVSSEFLRFEINKRFIKILQKQINNDRSLATSVDDSKYQKKGQVIKQIVTAMAVCHNVTPVTENGEWVLQASSPDEIALVKAAEDFGLLLQNWDLSTITLYWSYIKNIVKFEILYIFPFSSATKRMGIIVKDLYDQIIFYEKGADFIMKSIIKSSKKGYLMDECDNLSEEGLRTLVYGYKILKKEYFLEWEQKYKIACESLQNREQQKLLVMEELEKDMEFLAVTGVEDKLQNNCAQTIEALKSAGIQFWILTGDKVETVSCVAISTGLKTPDQEFYHIVSIKTQQQLLDKLNRFSQLVDKGILVIDGESLEFVEFNEEYFFWLADQADGIVCCRCSPTQKAYIVQKVKFYSNKITLAIGDGGNDVPMIMEADVGVGIVGKEGKQAALASDFSLEDFEGLKDLLLWHGRNSYRRGAIMAQFVIHRGLIISVMQLYYFVFIDYLKLSLFNGYLLLGYATIYTMFPVFALIFDFDIDWKTATKFPILYQTLQKGRELNLKTFLIWVFISIYQALFIVYLNFLLFEQSVKDFTTTAFSALIFIQLLNSFQQTHSYNIFVLFSIAFSIVSYLLSFIYLKDYFDVTELSVYFFIKIFIISLASYLPIVIIQKIAKWIYPTQEQRIMKKAKIKQKSTFWKFFEKFFKCKKNDIIEKKDFL